MRAVLFDVDGVLLHSHVGEISDNGRRYTWRANLSADFGFGPDALRPFFRERFPDIVAGRKALVDELADYLPTIGYRGSPLNLVSYWLKNDTHPNLALVEAIKTVNRSGAARLFLATNQEHLRALHLWRDLGLSHLFEDILYSARLGAAKPDPDFFARVDRVLGPQDSPPLFFDDKTENIEAARAHGWDAQHFTRMEHFTGHPFIAPLLGNGHTG